MSFTLFCQISGVVSKVFPLITLVYVKWNSNLADIFAKEFSWKLVRVTSIEIGLKPF